MKSFDFVNATTLEAAGELLEEQGAGAQAIAGGTDALGVLKDRVHKDYPETLINLKSIPGLDYLRAEDDGLVIGAMTRLHSLETDPALGEKYPMLADAARAVASPQLRNMGTVAGNICQEPRCWYYRAPDDFFDCIRKGGANCNALTGENQYHSLFGSATVGLRPCTSGCPTNVNIPPYMAELRSGDLGAAASILLKNNPLPAITGRVCPHYCEQNCNRALSDEAVSVRSVERHLGDYVLEHASKILPPVPASGPGVAVIGAGPAGMSCAFYLRRAGHPVTVFEKMPEAGGMVRYTIPAYRLSAETVRRQVAVLEEIGVEFRYQVEVGKDLSLDELRSTYGAVFMAPGAWGHLKLGVKGEELLTSGLPFLAQAKDGLCEKPGENVLVIGGGNVAMDVARTCARMGAKKVQVVYRRTQDEMPAFPWEIEEAAQDGVEFKYLTAPLGCEEGDQCAVGGLVCQPMELGEPDESGRCRPVPTLEAPFVMSADVVISAIGQKADLDALDENGVLRAGGTWIGADEATQATALAGVFAGGDAVSGPSTVVAAIAAGRKAARSIMEYLGDKPEEKDEPACGGLNQFNPDFLGQVPRVDARVHPKAEIDLDAEETESLSLGEVEHEANRCFNCGCVASSPSDLAPALIALGATIKTTKRTLEAEEFFCATRAGSTILSLGELVKEVKLPAVDKDTKQAFLKFRIRKSIDFPIVDVATVLKTKGGLVAQARIVLGAVAPVPLRATKAEAFLRGKELSEETAAQAAALATSECIPLGRNGYKAQVLRALVKRALCAE